MQILSTLRYHFIVLALLAGIHTALAQPTLSIASANNQVVLFWPITATGTNYVLQNTIDLALPNWVSATDAVPVDYDSQYAVSVSNTSLARFFRLSLVPPSADGMALIPAGSFTMGDTLDGQSDAYPTNVYVSAFYMDTNLVSYSQWQTVYSYATNHGYGFSNTGAGKAANHPVQTVNWYDCVKWCNARSEMSGLAPVYFTDASQTTVYRLGSLNLTNDWVNWTANGYRLPTEAEWEKAARGALVGKRFPWGDTISSSQANYYGNTAQWFYDLGPNGFNPAYEIGDPPYTAPVGSFPPNGYSLYDMAGNVFEWCWDRYGTPYAGGTDPHGPISGNFREARGGNWYGHAGIERCAFRVDFSPIYTDFYMGFRCVRGL